jgi:hypothetical protein
LGDGADANGKKEGEDVKEMEENKRAVWGAEE